MHYFHIKSVRIFFLYIYIHNNICSLPFFLVHLLFTAFNSDKVTRKLEVITYTKAHSVLLAVEVIESTGDKGKLESNFLPQKNNHSSVSTNCSHIGPKFKFATEDKNLDFCVN